MRKLRNAVKAVTVMEAFTASNASKPSTASSYPLSR